MLSTSRMVAYVPASDLERARRFYEEKLGLAPAKEYAGGPGLVYECGEGTTFFMYQSGGAGSSKASQAFWAVDDLDAEMAELRSRGLVFLEYDLPGLKTVDGVATGGGAKTAWFQDSEGNIMALAQTVRDPASR